MGRISPGHHTGVRNGGGRGGGNDLYGKVEGSIGNSFTGATKSGGVLNLDFCESCHSLSEGEGRGLGLMDWVGLELDTGYFDVDTVTVLTRCYKTLLPMEDYVADVLGGVPDLYG